MSLIKSAMGGQKIHGSGQHGVTQQVVKGDGKSFDATRPHEYGKMFRTGGRVMSSQEIETLEQAQKLEAIATFREAQVEARRLGGEALTSIAKSDAADKETEVKYQIEHSKTDMKQKQANAKFAGHISATREELATLEGDLRHLVNLHNQALNATSTYAASLNL